MKIFLKALKWIVLYYVLISIVFYLYLCIRFSFSWPGFSIFYNWWLIYNHEKTDYSIYVFDWLPIIFATALLIAYTIYLNRRKLIFLFNKLKQNTKSARIARLEQELEELKKNK